MSERSDLAVSVGDWRIFNPVLVAAGCGADGRELARRGDLAGLGGFVTPTVRRDRCDGPGPRYRETPSGLLRGLGARNPGVDAFLATSLPWLIGRGITTVVSIGGSTLGELAELTRRVSSTPGVAAIEVNLNADPGTGWGRGTVQAARAVSVVRRDSAPGLPVLAKIRAGDGDPALLADALASAGADGIVVAGVVQGLDPVPSRAGLPGGDSGFMGELSGPSLLPLTAHSVHRVRERLPGIGLVAVGGVWSGMDAWGLLAAGADAVQLGGVLLADPDAPIRILGELRAILAERGWPQFSTPPADPAVAGPEDSGPAEVAADRRQV